MGKTSEPYLAEGLALYSGRLKHYCTFETCEIPGLKKPSPDPEMQKKNEGALILQKLEPGDRVFLLDEKGKEYDSVNFARLVQQQLNHSAKRLVFVTGGAFGFSEDVYRRANGKISLSKMTFSHQLVRLLFLEQLYRAFTIIKGEKYHHS